ncbi:DUF84 family protein [Pseudogracilibacillus sp. SO30301A]|uniref:DUF84 family protein n=1 Tax=Pseudogracilibacillus sp. SO30301A TaxID=3098291 RepID=UPI00300E41E1
MRIVIGSLNETKINAVKKVFPEAEIIADSIPSNVSAQPIGDEETELGAINRAKNAHHFHQNSVCIGLEGGVMLHRGELLLCNWGALVTADGKTYTASGARIKLPNNFKNKIEQGLELSEIMDNYIKKKHIRHHEGAIGIFTNGRMLRMDMFSHVVTLLRGQMEYWSK